MRRLRWMVVVPLLVALSPGPARAAASPSVADVSWWTRVPNQTAPSGGLVVGTAPDGPTSVAALHLDLTTGGASGVKLQITEANGSVGGQAAAIRVCLTTASWQPTTGGALADAAATTCGASGADLARDASGGWSVSLDSILSAERGVIGIALVPGTAQAPAFDLHFGPPVFTATAAASSTSSDTVAASPQPVPVDAGSSLPSGGAVTGSDYQPVVVPDQGPVAATTVPSAVFGPPIAGDRAAVPLRITPSSHSRGQPYGKAFVYVVVSLLVGGAAAAGRRFSLPLLKGRTS